MKLKQLLPMLLIVLVLTLMAACNSDNESKEQHEKNSEETVKTETTSVAEKEENTEETGDSHATLRNGAMLNPTIIEESGGTVEVVYTNTKPGYVNDMNGFVVMVNSYQIVKITNMKQDVENRFKGASDGYVVTADISIENGQNEDVYYNHIMRLQMEDSNDYIPSNNYEFVPDDKRISWKEEISKFEPGFNQDIFLTFLMSDEEFQSLHTVEPKFIIGAMASNHDDFSDSFGSETVFDFILSDEHAKQVALAPKFYHDKLTTENIATKEMMYEDLEINETKQLNTFGFTIEGVQYTTITPNESSKERFSKFGDEELVAMTLKIKMDNQSDQMVWNDTSAFLIPNENEARILNHGIVENSDISQMQPGERAERYMVFLFEKKYFDIYETFQLEVGPFMGEDGYIFNEEIMTFELPSGR
ncbi:DUF5068 domain-containing protein [Ornithinibacillus xuwenensis]|uniref:DUF5068 domain-containing protein n=1 Tax=Ornithinibacillus xuwenensis TaxID=3144668 RepID=A0ABU9XHM9_9BACI